MTTTPEKAFPTPGALVEFNGPGGKTVQGVVIGYGKIRGRDGFKVIERDCFERGRYWKISEHCITKVWKDPAHDLSQLFIEWEQETSRRKSKAATEKHRAKSDALAQFDLHAAIGKTVEFKKSSRPTSGRETGTLLKITTSGNLKVQGEQPWQQFSVPPQLVTRILD